MSGETSGGLAIFVRFHDGRYHGRYRRRPEWPPSPGRLFQALVAGAGPLLADERKEALRWLERLDPPLIKAPVSWPGREMRLFVPNNDLDAVGGDPARVPELRVPKLVHPTMFEANTPVAYFWTFPRTGESEAHAAVVCDVADGLYQLGRGVDMAFATAMTGPANEVRPLVDANSGVLYRPSRNGAGRGRSLACPVPGSIDSLVRRHAAGRERFRTEPRGRSRVQAFSQQPKPVLREVPYNAPPSRTLFDFRPGGDLSRRASFCLAQVVHVVEAARDAAAERFGQAVPGRAAEFTSAVVGRRPGEPGVRPQHRVRLIPVPSIGMEYADRGIRRLLVEVPLDSTVAAHDVIWAFSGVEFPSAAGGASVVLVRSDDRRMLDHYGIGERHRVWRTVTPAALPEPARRRRIDPGRRTEEAKAGKERVDEEARAAFAVTQALRHAGVDVAPDRIRVQREPFESRGERTEAFGAGTRFPKERLWHAEISFSEPVSGPLVVGDGRFLGLGLMAPVREHGGIVAFAIESGLTDAAEPGVLARALRRAVMARVQHVIGPNRELPAYFSGHLPGGAPATSKAPHLAFAFDPERLRLLIVAPHRRIRKDVPPSHRRYLSLLDEALAGFRELRAGRAGKLVIQRISVDELGDPLLAPSKRWKPLTAFVVNRHAKETTAADALKAELEASCRELGLPKPEVSVIETCGLPGIGLTGHATLRFDIAVQGPLLLGRTRHVGGGLFARADQ